MEILSMAKLKRILKLLKLILSFPLIVFLFLLGWLLYAVES